MVQGSSAVSRLIDDSQYAYAMLCNIVVVIVSNRFANAVIDNSIRRHMAGWVAGYSWKDWRYERV